MSGWEGERPPGLPDEIRCAFCPRNVDPETDRFHMLSDPEETEALDMVIHSMKSEGTVLRHGPKGNRIMLIHATCWQAVRLCAGLRAV